MSHAVLTRWLLVVVCFLIPIACGETKEATKHDATVEASPPPPPPPPAPTPPPPDKQRSFLSAGCEEHGDTASKDNCLCRVDVMDATLDSDLLAKLESIPKEVPTSAVVEHLGGLANLSKVYEAMRKANQDCKEGASK